MHLLLQQLLKPSTSIVMAHSKYLIHHKYRTVIQNHPVSDSCQLLFNLEINILFGIEDRLTTTFKQFLNIQKYGILHLVVFHQEFLLAFH